MWAPFFLALHIVTAVCLFVLLRDYHFVDPALYEAVQESGATDAIKVASELGRLDVLTLAITLFTVVLAIVTVMGFWIFRGVVDQRTADEVRERLPMLLDEYLKRNPSVFAEAIRQNAGILRAGFIPEEDGADFSEEIARSMEGGQEPQNGNGAGNS